MLIFMFIIMKEGNNRIELDMKLTRRGLFELLAVGSSGALVAMTAPDLFKKPEPKDARTLTLSERVDPVNMTRILSALNSDVPAGKGDYIPDFLNLIQNNRIEATGESIQEKLRKNFRGMGINPNIEIQIVDGLGNTRNIEGMFLHSKDEKPSGVLMDADLKPALALNVLDHELVHASWGLGEVRAHLHSLLNITAMVGKAPELLMDGGDKSPLINLLHEFISDRNSKAKLDSNYANPFLACMHLLREQGNPLERALPRAVNFTLNQISEVDKTYAGRYYASRKVNGPGYVDTLHSNTFDAVNAYLQSINPRAVIPAIKVAF